MNIIPCHIFYWNSLLIGFNHSQAQLKKNKLISNNKNKKEEIEEMKLLSSRYDLIATVQYAIFYSILNYHIELTIYQFYSICK